MVTSNVVLGALFGLQLLAVGCSPPREAAQAGMEPLPAPTGPHTGSASDDPQPLGSGG